MPRLALSESLPVRDRPPSQYMATRPPSARIFSAVVDAPSLGAPRRTGDTPPGEQIQTSGGLKSGDLALNRPLRRMNAPAKKWSMNEKWLGARITGPDAGTFSLAIERARKKVHA